LADVFMSYVRPDRNLAEQVSLGLEASGFSVWWDREIRGGEDFSSKIEPEITAAKTVVVLWSAASQQSKWVRDEAAFARDANKLIPLKVDATEPPFGFRQVQTIDFQRWSGDPSSSAFGSLLASLRHFIDDAAVARVPDERTAARARTRRVSKWRWLVASVVAVAIVAGTVLLVGPRFGFDLASTSSGQSPDLASGRVLIKDFELMTSDDETARFAKGLTNTLEREFANIGLEAITRVDTVGAGEPIIAEFVLRGTVDRADGKLAVTTNVVHTRDGVVLWSKQRERDIRESQWLQERVALEAAGEISFALRARRYANDDTSSALLVSLMRFYSNDDPVQQMEMSIRLRDSFPQHAISHAVCAFAHAVGTVARSDLNTPDDPAATWAERERLLRKAIDLQPDLHFAVGLYYNVLEYVGRTRQGRLTLDRVPLDRISDLWAPRMTRAYSVLRASAPSAYHTTEVDAARTEFERVANIWPESDTNAYWFEAELWFGDPVIATRLATKDSVMRDLSIWGAKPKRCLDMFIDARLRRLELTQAEIDAGCVEGFHTAPESIYGYFGHADAAYRAIEKRYESYARNSFGNWRVNLFESYMRVVRADVRFMPLAQRLGLVEYWLDTDQWPDFCTTEKLPYDCKEAALATRAAATKA
jgi:TolB-like protein